MAVAAALASKDSAKGVEEPSCQSHDINKQWIKWTKEL